MSRRSRHPEPDELLAFHFGALTEDERDPVEEHLSVCSECAQAVLDFEAFPELEDEPEIPPEVGRRLQDRRRSLLEMTRGARDTEIETTPVVIHGGETLPVRRTGSAGLAWALAAVFFVATVGLGVWSAGQRGTLGAGDAQVYPGSVTSPRSAEDGSPVRILLDGTPVFVALQVTESFPRYRVVLEGPSGKEISSTDLTLTFESKHISYNLPLPLSPGSYRLKVSGLGEGFPTYLGYQELELLSTPEGPSEEAVKEE